MTYEAMSPLRRRMIEDMTIRKFAPKTQHDYVQRVKDFAVFLGRSPNLASQPSSNAPPQPRTSILSVDAAHRTRGGRFAVPCSTTSKRVKPDALIV